MLAALLVAVLLAVLVVGAVRACAPSTPSCDPTCTDCDPANCPQAQTPAPQQYNQRTSLLQPLPQRPLPEMVREWRIAAWQRDDIFAQITLGDLYSRDDSFYDPVEAYVWYFMALRPGHYYNAPDDVAPAMDQLWDHAADREDTLFDSMSLDQRLEARRRLIYILACRGRDGFIDLGNLHQDLYDPGSDVCREEKPRDCVLCRFFGGDDKGHTQRDGYDRRICEQPRHSAIVPSNADALMYYTIAQNLGHPLAPAFVAEQEHFIMRTNPAHGEEIVADARSRARNWFPPMEFYSGQTRGGTLETDECVEGAGRHLALMRTGEISQTCLLHALYLQSPAKLDPPLDPRQMDIAVRHFQEAQQDDVTGILTPEETVRLIQMGAVDGDVQLQTYLGVMYAKGIGVVRNFQRAAYWFDRADRQGSGEATYYLGVLYKVGVDGIPHDADKAARLFTEAALRGFDPSRSLMLDMLAAPVSHIHADGPHDEHRPDEHRHIHRDHHRRPPQ